jgi:hypothetical protein
VFIIRFGPQQIEASDEYVLGRHVIGMTLMAAGDPSECCSLCPIVRADVTAGRTGLTAMVPQHQ